MQPSRPITTKSNQAPALPAETANIKAKLPDLQLDANDERALQGKNEMERKIYLLRKKLSVRRDSALFGRRNLKNPDPAKVYTWVNTREERQMLYQSMGYEVCHNADVGSNYWKPEEKIHKVADLILYEIDRDLYELDEANKVITGLELSDPKQAEVALRSALIANGAGEAPIYRPHVTR